MIRISNPDFRFWTGQIPETSQQKKQQNSPALRRRTSSAAAQTTARLPQNQQHKGSAAAALSRTKLIMHGGETSPGTPQKQTNKQTTERKEGSSEFWGIFLQSALVWRIQE